LPIFAQARALQLDQRRALGYAFVFFQPRMSYESAQFVVPPSGEIVWRRGVDLLLTLPPEVWTTN